MRARNLRICGGDVHGHGSMRMGPQRAVRSLRQHRHRRTNKVRAACGGTDARLTHHQSNACRGWTGERRRSGTELPAPPAAGAPARSIVGASAESNPKESSIECRGDWGPGVEIERLDLETQQTVDTRHISRSPAPAPPPLAARPFACCAVPRARTASAERRAHLRSFAAWATPTGQAAVSLSLSSPAGYGTGPRSVRACRPPRVG